MEEYVKRVCGKKMCLRTEISCTQREGKGSETFFNRRIWSYSHVNLRLRNIKYYYYYYYYYYYFNVNFVRKKKKRFPTKSIHQISISDMRMLLLTGKIGKAYYVRNFFFFTRSTKFPPLFSNLEPGARLKLAHAEGVMLPPVTVTQATARWDSLQTSPHSKVANSICRQTTRDYKTTV